MNIIKEYDKMILIWTYIVVGDFMSDKTKGKKNNISNLNKRKREKFIKPLITDEDLNEENDAFFSVVKNRAKIDRKELDKRQIFFLSPMRGKVEDHSTFPVTSSKGKIGKQYDFLRQDKKLKQEELKNQFGHEYYEFNLLNNRNKQAKNQTETEKNTTSVPHMHNTTFKEEMNPSLENYNEDEIVNTDPSKINIIYEEEIEIDDNQHIVTSYDDNSKVTFFDDFDAIQNNRKEMNFNSNVDVYEHHVEHKGLKAELKKLFAEDDYTDENDKYVEEPFGSIKKNGVNNKEQKLNTVQFKDETITRGKNDFINIKEELDQELNVNLKSKTKETKINHHNLDQYVFPSLDLLHEGTTFIQDDVEWIENQMKILDSTLESFGIGAKTVNYTQGPSVTRYEIEPDPGIKVSRITALQDDIKLRLAASNIRIEAPISGKSTVGVEVPNQEIRMVRLREILDSHSYKAFKSPLKIALGLDITGEPVFSDISNMTHSLIAGSTGSGKSVCINSIIISILYNAFPDEVKLVLIDPKKVEFSMYRDIPHLLTPVISDTKIATATLKWLTEEMDRRYELIESAGARDIKSYNIKRNRSVEDLPKLPYIVVIIDELADLMIVAAAEVEEYIQRISQLARAAGIHLIVATQRPSTNIITGTIKTNIPTRISFKVASSIDSRIILDEVGAEKLLGKGDMLLSDNGKPQLKRLQGSFISDEEIEKITNSVKEQMSPVYLFTGEDLVKKENEFMVDYEEVLFDDAVRFVIELGEASASKIQRQFKVGYNRAARMIDMMEKYNIVGPQQSGSKPRDVLMSLDEYESMINF